MKNGDWNTQHGNLDSRPRAGGKRMVFAGVLALAVAVAACSSTGSSANKVRTTSNSEDVKGCKSLGTVRANAASMSGRGGSFTAEGSAEEMLREKAAHLGADVLLVTESGTRATGEAYLCGAPKQ